MEVGLSPDRKLLSIPEGVKATSQAIAALALVGLNQRALLCLTLGVCFALNVADVQIMGQGVLVVNG